MASERTAGLPTRFLDKLPALPPMLLRPAFLLVLVALLLPVFGGCSNESDGQPCDPHNNPVGTVHAGDPDCAYPLICTSITPTDYRCCQPNRDLSSSVICHTGASGAEDAASPAPPDASSGDDVSATDSTIAPGTESGAETSSGSGESGVPGDDSGGAVATGDGGDGSTGDAADAAMANDASPSNLVDAGSTADSTLE